MTRFSAYEEWQRVLEHEFFGTQMAGHAAIFCVDESVESLLMHDNGLLVELADAVNEELHWGRPAGLFDKIMLGCDVWGRGDRAHAPPSLPLLAATVLAASNMAADSDISSSNYYYRLAEVLRRGAGERDLLRNRFLTVVTMWKQLDAWLDFHDGELGFSTISTDKHWTRIGYPMSQALLREQDRRILTTFFAASDVKPGCSDEFPGQEIIRRLRLWTSRSSHGLSPRLLKVLREAGAGSEATDEGVVLALLLERLVEYWDGKLYERGHRARRAASLRLVLGNRGRQLHWVAESAEGISGTVVQSARTGCKYQLSDPYGGFYNGLGGLPVAAAQLLQGLVLEGEDLHLSWTAEDLVFFTEDEYSGDFISVSTFNPGEPHTLLVANSALRGVRAVVAQIADPGRLREQASPIPGWTLIKNVDLDVAVTAAELTDGRLLQAAHFVPSTRRGIRLTGGLRIGSDLGHHHYLRGGAPDWLLPRDVSQGEVDIEVVLSDDEGSHTQNFRLQRVLRPVPVREWPLSDGLNRVSTPDGGRASFTLCSGLYERQAPQAGSLGHRCGAAAELEAHALAADTQAIRGAKAPQRLNPPQTLLVPRTVRDLVLVGAHGEVTHVELPEPPDWMKSRLRAEAYAYRSEVDMPDGYVWAIQHMASHVTVKPLMGAARIPDPVAASAGRDWAAAVLSGAETLAGSEWSAYVAAAREVMSE